MWISTASSAERRGHFKTALKAARVEQTDKLYGCCLTRLMEKDLCCALTFPWDMGRGFITLIPLTTHPNPTLNHPLTPQHHYLRLRLQASWVQALHYKMMRRFTFPATVWAGVLTVNAENERRSYGNCWLTMGHLFEESSPSICFGDISIQTNCFHCESLHCHVF